MIPKIAESEWRIMKILWQRSPQRSHEIIDQLAGKVEWKPKTIKTLLNRLVNKKAIDFKKEGRVLVDKKDSKQKTLIQIANRM